MNDDLKPSDHAPISGMTVPRAFVLAQLVALRFRSSAASEGERATAALIAERIHELAKAWGAE